MKSIPSRPLRSDIVLKAISEYIEKNDVDMDPETIAEHSCFDGWDLMQDLQKYSHWELERDDLDTLDEICAAVDKEHRDAESKWALEHDVISKALPAGTQIEIGVIAGVYEHMAGYYLVKTPLCSPSSHRIVKFEDAGVIPATA